MYSKQSRETWEKLQKDVCSTEKGEDIACKDAFTNELEKLTLDRNKTINLDSAVNPHFECVNLEHHKNRDDYKDNDKNKNDLNHYGNKSGEEPKKFKFILDKGFLRIVDQENKDATYPERQQQTWGSLLQNSDENLRTIMISMSKFPEQRSTDVVKRTDFRPYARATSFQYTARNLSAVTNDGKIVPLIRRGD